MNRVENEKFKVPYGTLRYDEFNFIMFLKHFYNIFSFRFFWFYFIISKYAFVKYPRIKSFLILRQILYMYMVIKDTTLCKNRRYNDCLQLAKSWGSGDYNAEIIKILEST